MTELIDNLKSTLKIILLLILVGSLIHYTMHGTLSTDAFMKYCFYNIYFGFPLSLINGWFNDRLSLYIPWEDSPKLRGWLGFFGSILITMITVVILIYILWVLIEGNDISILYAKRTRSYYLISLVITIIISSLLHAIMFFKEVTNERMKSDKLRQEKLRSELNALKAHVDPHFLFNSFNALSGLIDEDQEKAQNFLKSLSNIYRYILENRNESTNTIQEELRFAKTYLTLHQARFENSIFMDIQISDEVATKHIPVLSLQLLLENAVKHNAFSETEPLKIKIEADGEYISVSNNKKFRRNLNSSNRMGLKNITDRYHLLGYDNLEIRDLTNTFEVKLPLI